ncbi:Der1-like family-domain-containing protein, partial [Glomus cerebriforme]
MEELIAWFNKIPICTKFLFTNCVLISLLINIFPFVLAFLYKSSTLSFWSPQSILLEVLTIVLNTHMSLFLLPFNLDGAFQLYFLCQCSRDVETTKFSGRTADYIVFLLFEVLTILILGWLGWYTRGLVLLNQSLIMAIICTWSLYNRQDYVNFLFGIRFKGVYLPFVLLMFDMLVISGIPWGLLIGIITGYLYYYLKELGFLNTPRLLYRYFPRTSIRYVNQDQRVDFSYWGYWSIYRYGLIY